MDWGLVVTTVMAVVNLIVLSVGGATVIAKVRSVSETNQKDIKDIKEAQIRMERKQDEQLRLVYGQGQKIASLETGLKHLEKMVANGGGRNQEARG